MSATLILGILQLVLEYAPEAVAAIAAALRPAAPDLTDQHQAAIDLLIAQGAEAALKRAQGRSAG